MLLKFLRRVTFWSCFCSTTFIIIKIFFISYHLNTSFITGVRVQVGLEASKRVQSSVSPDTVLKNQRDERSTPKLINHPNTPRNERSLQSARKLDCTGHIPIAQHGPRPVVSIDLIRS